MSRSTQPSLPAQLSMAISRPTLTRSLPSDSYERYTRPRDAPPHPTTRPFSWGLGDVDLLPTISPRRAPSPTSSIVTEELSKISRPVSAWLGWSQRRTSNLSRGWSLTPKKKTFQNPVSPHQVQFHPPRTFSSPPSPSPFRHTPAPFLVPIDSTPSSRSSPSFSGHIAATTNHSSVTESDGRVAAWLGAARRASDDMHERAKPPIYAVLRDDDGSERTLGPWPLPPRRLPIPLPTLPPLIPTPPPPSPIRVYHYPAVAGWSAHHLPLAHSPFEDPILWKEERKGIFDAMWGVCVAALAYLLALIRRQEGGSASIHTEALPSHGTSAELIRRNVEF
ncbi:hypothetical protein CcaverHIS631_0204370 [Cutaneotrichosporon cavernicola]|nr:hypothetical protein CcaverHIS631_0204370 [Cutaneotrichosporon cavernicola]